MKCANNLKVRERLRITVGHNLELGFIRGDLCLRDNRRIQNVWRSQTLAPEPASTWYEIIDSVERKETSVRFMIAVSATKKEPANNEVDTIIANRHAL